jgi:hypothetical protein
MRGPWPSVTITPMRISPMNGTRAGPGRSRNLLLLGALLVLPAAQAWVLTVSPGPRTIYLQVGNGSFTGNLSTGGTPLNNPTVNVVSVTVPATSVGTGTAQSMTSDSTAAASFYDNYTVCTPPAQVYVGGFARLPSGAGNAVLSVTTPANLTNGSNVVPFNRISWTSTAIGNATADIPAGTFNGATQILRNIAAGTWVENCLTFSYANTSVVPQGTYTGRATYSLSLP